MCILVEAIEVALVKSVDRENELMILAWHPQQVWLAFWSWQPDVMWFQGRFYARGEKEIYM